MLYNRYAVKSKVPVTLNQITMIRNSPVLKLNAGLREFFDAHFIKKRNDLETILHATKRLTELVQYDYIHRFKGIRTPIQTLCDLKGHCIEQNTLLYVLLRHLGVQTSFTVTKNPKGFKIKLTEKGVHPFLKFTFNRKDYLADQVSGGVYLDRNFWCASRQGMSIREFTSFSFLMGGEDMSRGHGNPQEALPYYKAALLIDPNNYPVHVLLADSLMDLGKTKKAKEHIKKAVEIAPRLADPFKEWGDILLDSGQYQKAVRAYCEAAERDSLDIQVLYSLEKQLHKFGETSARKKVYEKRNRLADSKPDLESEMTLIKISPVTRERMTTIVES